MGRKLVLSVRVQNPEGAHVVIPAGEEVPSWATDQVTNPAAFGEETPSEQAAEPVDYESMTVADLRQEVDSRGLEVEGSKKADLVAALEASDRG